MLEFTMSVAFALLIMVLLSHLSTTLIGELATQHPSAKLKMLNRSI